MTVSVGELNNRLEIFAERISELEDMYEEFLRYGAVWQGNGNYKEVKKCGSWNRVHKISMSERKRMF